MTARGCKDRVRKTSTRMLAFTCIVCLGAMLLTAGAASANGPCGQNDEGASACGVNSPATDPGSLTTDNENDYYVLYAQQGTELHVSVTNTANPSCSQTDEGWCGNVKADLFDSQGNDTGEGSGSSTPNKGITVPASFDTTLTTGTYYLIVTGSMGADQYGNPTAVPYSLAVTASPNVVWPAPSSSPPPGPTPTPTPTPAPKGTKGWSNAINLNAGPLGSGPTAGVDGVGNQYVFWEGTNGALWDRWYLNNSWHGPAKIGAAGLMGSEPAVAVQPSGQQDVFWRGRGSGQLWESWHTSSWHAAVNLHAGRLGSEPAAGADKAGDEFVFWRGLDGHLWDKWYVGNRWHGPALIQTAGKIASAPAVAVNPAGGQYVFWQGLDGNLWETTYNNGWKPAVNLHAGPLGSAPTAGVDSKGEIFVFWQGTGGDLWDRWFTAGHWNGPARIASGGTMGSPPSVAVQKGGQQDVFWKGTDGDLWETWHP
jgi:hypothetical protein